MKQVILGLSLASGLLFGADYVNKIEITPTYNYNVFEGNLGLNKKGGAGIKFGYHFDNIWIDQAELGFDYFSNIKYKNTDLDTDLSRYYLNAIKGIDLTNSLYIYGLIGAGYENFSNSDNKNKDGGFGQYGAGLKVRISDNLALRLEAKDLITFNDAHHSFVTTAGLSFSFGATQPKEEIIEEEIIKEEVILEEKIITIDGYFGFDKTNINSDFKGKIKEVSQILEQNQNYNVLLEGHTDNIGNAEYNQKLSVKRAQSVANELEKFGVAKEKIQVKGYGESQPKYDNNTKEGRAKNRRVDARFYLNEAQANTPTN